MISVALECSPEVDDKTLLQKAPHILAAGYKEIKLEAFSLLIDFLSYQRCYAGFRGIKVTTDFTQVWTLQAITPAFQARCTFCYSSGMAVIGVTNHFLVRFEAHTPGEIHSWSYKPGQKPTNGEVTYSREGKTCSCCFAKWTWCQIMFIPIINALRLG